jgi:hypothetical protein
MAFFNFNLGFTAGSPTRIKSDQVLKQHIAYTCYGREGSMETIPQGCDTLRTIVEFPSCVGRILLCLQLVEADFRSTLVGL